MIINLYILKIAKASIFLWICAVAKPFIIFCLFFPLFFWATDRRKQMFVYF